MTPPSDKIDNSVSRGNAQKTSSLERLAREAFRFDFFQAVRLLELANQNGTSAPTANPVGMDFAPDSEPVRFRAAANQRFPGSKIVDYREAPASRDGTSAAKPAEMTVSFLGLTGPSGVLPQHYTQRLIDDLRHDSGMLEFLDLFNHRLISLFYRVWKKYRFPVSYETDSLTSRRLTNERIDERDTGDLFTFGLFSMIGRGTGGVRDRQVLPDEGLLYFAGQLTQHSPTAISLERMVSDYFGLPTEVVQFVGQWLPLTREDQTCMSSGGHIENKQLGVSAIAGSRVWSIESKFRIRLGPLNYDQFWEYLPVNSRLLPLAQFVRTYVGPEFDFEVQLVLRREAFPDCRCRLGENSKYGARLGWNTWLFGESLNRDADEAVFQVEGGPVTSDKVATAEMVY